MGVVGPSNSGKTRLVVGTAAELRRRGWRVATIKHTPHGHALQPAGTDTAAHLSAQPAAVALVTPGGVALVRPGPPDPEALIARDFSDVDFVLVEGWRSAPWPAVWVRRPEQPEDGDWQPPTRLLAVAGAPAAPGCPQIPATGPAMADLVEALVRAPAARR